MGRPMGKRRFKVNTTVHRLLANANGASAAEFALVLPVFMLLIFGTFQISLLMFSYNRMTSAANAATRAMAVCTYSSSTAAQRALGNLPAWVKPSDWTITPSSDNLDVSMSISVDPAKAGVITLLPIFTGPLETHVTMRKEPPAFGGGISCP